MEEMSPYRRVRSPHVHGYFGTAATGFTLIPLSDERSRLEVEAQHILRVEPALYREPLARLAIRLNMARVLGDVRQKAEQDRGAAHLASTTPGS